jgi:hypothetical protein|tara:strand:- start:233 stop:550 length:318 start_codon:yes stop_codon:yes gene_type:complete
MAAKLALFLLLVLGAFPLMMACNGGGDSHDTMHGRVTDVQTRSITEIESLSVVDEAGETWLFATEGPLELTPSHLREHMLGGDEIRVRFKRVDAGLIAVGISDYP